MIQKNWDKYRRKTNNIKKSEYNSEVSQLLSQHYKYLYSLLVKREDDKDIFNDTFLKLTYKYNQDKDFIDQFKFWFGRLKGEYYRDDKVTNYYVTDIEDRDFPEIEEVYVKTKKLKIKDLKDALVKEASKTA